MRGVIVWHGNPWACDYPQQGGVLGVEPLAHHVSGPAGGPGWEAAPPAGGPCGSTKHNISITRVRFITAFFMHNERQERCFKVKELRAASH